MTDKIEIEDFLNQNVFTPKMKFRWIIDIPGIPSYMFAYCKSLPDKKIEIGIQWQKDKEPHAPTGNSGNVKLIDIDGTITDEWELMWAYCEPLHFDLDYASNDSIKMRYLLRKVELRKIK